ncbi:hypothetical protein H4R18_004810 [Coemansia javaensis]|uniref:MPN domain-containing protein n=1 Tax=Coemansia javaensis TaxID=2761396 RepID=A0A9W8H8C9_9FUNG|nr:hypothetical protein H4R18_004810 [Coemansia javaensis]
MEQAAGTDTTLAAGTKDALGADTALAAGTKDTLGTDTALATGTDTTLADDSDTALATGIDGAVGGDSDTALADSGAEAGPGAAVGLGTAVSEAERQGCREFFLGRANKTPERYVRIRNHMMQAWAAQRPQYLTKIKARAGLKGCGDVNAIGRVHAFLESAGAINAGAEAARRRPPPANGAARRRPPAHGGSGGSGSSGSSDEDAQSDGGWRGPGAAATTGRRRRVRGPDGAWVNEDEYYGGHVIAHDVVERHADDEDYSCSSASSDGGGGGGGRKGRKRRRGGGDERWRHNSNSEFRLIPCREFGAVEAPFAVRITAAALALMDLHAHLMYTEIIGLLGGHFLADQRTVEVDIAFPCRSTSTTTECEMDPASEVEARRVFSAAGRQAVGWFHSHPTFEATPSVRDIHNQRAYQALCRRASDRVEPFVGLIVSPPGGGCTGGGGGGGAHGVSDIGAFYVLPGGDGDGAEGVPYQIAYEVTGRDQIPDDLLDAMAHLIETHAGLAQRADLAKRFRRNGAMTALEKLTLSMRARWAAAAHAQWDAGVTARLRPLLLRHFFRGARPPEQ